MYFVAAVLLVLPSVLYAAGNHELGSLGADVPLRPNVLRSPLYLLLAAGTAAVWRTFVSIGEAPISRVPNLAMMMPCP